MFASVARFMSGGSFVVSVCGWIGSPLGIWPGVVFRRGLGMVDWGHAPFRRSSMLRNAWHFTARGGEFVYLPKSNRLLFIGTTKDLQMARPLRQVYKFVPSFKPSRSTLRRDASTYFDRMPK